MDQNQPFNPKAQANTWKTEAAQQLDTKNLGILQDQMHHEALAYKKCSVYTQYFTDPALRDIAGQAAQHHKQHFEALQNYLNSHQ